jgi:hypothetical protein
MNEILQQLMSMGPGIGVGLSGNGNAMSAFMEGYQRTQQMLEERKRQQQQDALGMEDRQLRLEDRQRNIDRQATADEAAAQDRQQRQALQGLQIPDQLAERGATAQDPQSAQALIESAMPNLMKAFGQEAMAYGQPAVQMAQAKITGRQKKQVSDYVEAALKTAYVADNPDADPELQLPEHVSKILGKPSARLSEVQSFAQLPVGKPAGRPSDVPSLQSKEVMVNGKLTLANYNPKTGTYTDQAGQPVVVDAVPPKPTGGDGGLNTNQSANLAEKLAKGWNDANASAREMKRQLSLMDVGLKRFKQGDKNGGSQAVLVTFQKILDPTSVVRETEYARSAQGISMLSRLQGMAERLQAGGAGVPEAELASMVETARAMLAEMESHTSSQRSRIEAMAREYKINPVLIFGLESPPAPAPNPNASQPRPGTTPPKRNPFRPQQ